MRRREFEGTKAAPVQEGSLSRAVRFQLERVRYEREQPSADTDAHELVRLNERVPFRDSHNALSCGRILCSSICRVRDDSTSERACDKDGVQSEHDASSSRN